MEGDFVIKILPLGVSHHQIAESRNNRQTCATQYARCAVNCQFLVDLRPPLAYVTPRV